jgi:hypothetical protein
MPTLVELVNRSKKQKSDCSCSFVTTGERERKTLIFVGIFIVFYREKVVEMFGGWTKNKGVFSSV